MAKDTGSRRLGRYELRELLGRGGMAEVWKALDTQLQRYVAIKLLHADLQDDPTFMTRFLREARIMASLHHPNIVQIHDFQVSGPPESEGPLAYIVMDYIEGPTLADYIATTSGKQQFPPAPQIVNLFLSIGSAVDFAAQKGMVHRDIKPANILLDTQNTLQNPAGEPMLTDFGITRLIATSTGVMSGSWLGTLTYTSPEQIQGHPGNELSDIYSLGIILYEICTGTLPFQNTDTVVLLSQHLNEIYTPPERINPRISPALSQVIQRCLAKDPQARFSSGAQLAAALAQAFNVSMTQGLNPQAYQTSASGIGAPGNPAHTATLQQQQHVASPITPIVYSTAPGMLQTGGISQPTPNTIPNPSSITPPVQPIRRKRKPFLIALIVLLVVVLAGAGLGTFFLLAPKAGAPANPGGGIAFFVSSGLINEGSNQGIEDQLQITLHNIPDAAPGKSYYAWLLNDEMQSTTPCHFKPLAMQSTYLGRLTVSSSGNVSLLYPGDSQHTNLFATTSRLLITEDSASGTPTPPSTNRSTWRYFAEIPQVPAKVGSCFSALDNIRHILSEGVTISQYGVHGGLNLNVFKNTQKILEWAGSAEGEWRVDPGFIHRQVIRILDILDGTKYINKDVPPGTPLLLDNSLTHFPMLKPYSYLDRVDLQLRAILQSPALTSQIRQIATQDQQALNNLHAWLEQVYTDAKQLVNMNATQLAAPAALQLLNDMQAQANYLFIGQLEPSSGNLKIGVMQMYYSLQQLAAFNVQPYTAH